MLDRKLTLDDAFDRFHIPDELGVQSAIVGHRWVGRTGLVDELELMLGLAQPREHHVERIAKTAIALRTHGGEWTASARRDPIGTARRILQVLDALGHEGWRGEPVTPRLGALASLLDHIPPGIPPRIHAVTDVLDRRSVPLERLELLEPPETYPRSWRELFGALRRRGSRIVRRSCSARHPPAPAIMVRPPGPTTAAEDLAAWVAARASLDDVVIVGGGGILDRALAQFGLPSTGIDERASSLLTLLPLVLAMGLEPIDPHEAYQLLAMPLSPVPRGVAWRLMRALQDRPAVGSSTWMTAVAEHGGDFAADGIFAPIVARDAPYPAVEARRRARLLETWAQDRQRASDLSAEERRCVAQVVTQCRTLARFLDLEGSTELPLETLRAWTDLATEAMGDIAALPARAGLRAVHRPEAVVAPIPTVVWWSFIRPNAARPHEVALLSKQDRAALANVGVRLPRPSEEALRDARRARRALTMATDQIVLVCPLNGDDGEPVPPHPLWDEIEPARRSVVPVLSTHARLVAARRLPASIRRWRAPRPLELREHESPSSLTTLLECSLRWALVHAGRTRWRGAAPPTAGSLVYGQLAHHVIEEAISARVRSPDETAQNARSIFDSSVSFFAPELLLPGRDLARGEVRGRIARAAAAFAAFVLETGARIESIERELEQSDPIGLRGRPDVVLDAPRMVVDLKWQRKNDRRKELERGTSLQLAAYAALADASSVAYLIVYAGQLLLGDDGPPPGEVWRAAQVAIHGRRAELGTGILVAPGNPDEDGEVHPTESALADGRLELAPACSYCDHAVLCGSAFGPQARGETT